MIVETLIKGIIYIIKNIFIILKSLFPMISVPIQFAYCLNIILSTTQQANNFIYFMLGDTAFILIPSLILLITYKYIAYPILTTLIGLIINKTS